MTARLIQFILDETAHACVKQCPQNHIDGVFDEEMFEDMTQLYQDPPELPGLPDGAYAVVIQADPMHDSAARITLVRLNDGNKPETIATTLIDLEPLKTSAVATGEEYENAVEEDYEMIQQKILLERTIPLQGVFEPHVKKDNVAFNLELLDILDYLTYPAILGKANAFNIEDAQQAGQHVITPSNMKLH